MLTPGRLQILHFKAKPSTTLPAAKANQECTYFYLILKVYKFYMERIILSNEFKKGFYYST